MIDGGRRPLRVWVEDREWLVPASHARCRHSTRDLCPNPPVADLPRGHTKQRWSYCAEHLYGRKFVDGKVMIAVRPDSPAAKQGFAS